VQDTWLQQTCLPTPAGWSGAVVRGRVFLLASSPCVRVRARFVLLRPPFDGHPDEKRQ
jgi:hypothetical protein